jgi:hypothetical protein
LPKLNSVGSFFQNNAHDTTLLSELPFFSFDGSFTDDTGIQIEACETHIEKISNFKSQHDKDRKFINIYHLGDR